MFQLYKLTSFNWNYTHFQIPCGQCMFQLYKLTSFNWNLVVFYPAVLVAPFQLYKLTSFNWNVASDRSEEPKLASFNCTNLHPSTETNETGEFLCSEYLVSIVQTYILQLKLYAFSNSVRSVRFNCTNLHPSTETYTVNRHRTSTLAVSIVQTYILQLKHNITMFHKGLVKVSIVQTYILQLKPLQKIEIRNRVRSFNCTNLHPSTETSSQKQCRWQKK